MNSTHEITWVRAQVVINSSIFMERTYRWTGVDPYQVQRMLELYIQQEQLYELGPWYISVSTNLDYESNQH